jgi:putative membrane protein insertion efficiency factor
MSLVARVMVGGIGVYRRFVSPLLRQNCRFHPTCSEYAVEAIRVHGAARGSLLAMKRIGRCHPWSPGGVDHVPAKRGI